jgi:single-stranded DNA-binding protein
VVCFNKTAEVAETYLHEGAKILLSATLDHNKWETEERQQKNTIQLIANRIEFIKADGGRYVLLFLSNTGSTLN